MKEQIDEMAECCPYFWNGACTVDAANPTDCDLMCKMFGFMTSLVNAGYRKQSEGKWINDNKSKFKHRYYCSACNFYLIGAPTNYCEECGAKMKGGAE